MNPERLSNADLEIEIILAAKKLARLEAIRQRRETAAQIPGVQFQKRKIKGPEAWAK